MRSARGLAAVVLVFEAFVVMFGALVAKDLSDLSPAEALGGGSVLALALVACVGLLRRRWGYVLGSALQVVVVATAVVVPAMAVVGLIFAGLWVAALVIGRRVAAGYAAPP